MSSPGFWSGSGSMSEWTRPTRGSAGVDQHRRHQLGCGHAIIGCEHLIHEVVAQAHTMLDARSATPLSHHRPTDRTRERGPERAAVDYPSLPTEGLRWPRKLSSDAG